MTQPEAWDKNGIPILPGDLLRQFSGRLGRHKIYHYYIARIDNCGRLIACNYDDGKPRSFLNGGINECRLVGRQHEFSVIAGIHRHEHDDKIIKKRYRKMYWTDKDGKKWLDCHPYERVKVKNETQNA